MKVFKRELEGRIKPLMFKNRAILIFGPRQSGKTTLTKKLIAEYGDAGVFFTCEHADVRSAFVLGRPELLKELVGDKKIVAFDEAQTITNIGAILKIFIDTYPDIQIIATGSSSFDLANKINEPLTGRTFEFTLYPLSLSEIKSIKINFQKEDLLNLLKLGSYPAIVGEDDYYVKENLLKNITTNYLYKDIYIFESIKKPQVFEDLLKLLAEQIGQLVSVNELALSLSTSRASIQKYLRLLEQSYVICVVMSFSKNSRNELKKAFKVYFTDLGIRNAILSRYSEVEDRSEKGLVFENFVFAEFLKETKNKNNNDRIYFWRTRQGLEIDFIVLSDGKIKAFECKWGETDVIFKTFLSLYPESETKVLNFNSFL